MKNQNYILVVLVGLLFCPQASGMRKEVDVGAGMLPEIPKNPVTRLASFFLNENLITSFCGSSPRVFTPENKAELLLSKLRAAASAKPWNLPKHGSGLELKRVYAHRIFTLLTKPAVRVGRQRSPKEDSMIAESKRLNERIRDKVQILEKLNKQKLAKFKTRAEQGDFRLALDIGKIREEIDKLDSRITFVNLFKRDHKTLWNEWEEINALLHKLPSPQNLVQLLPQPQKIRHL